MTQKSLTPIELPADPSAALEATTKQYVDNGLAGKSATSHNHDSTYLKLTGGSITGTIQADTSTRFRYSNSTTSPVGVDTGSVTQSPMGGLLWHDLLRFNDEFGAPTVQKNLNGTWTSDTSDSIVKDLFAGKQSASVTVSDPDAGTPWTGTRWTWTGVEYSSFTWLCIGFAYVANSAWTVLVETSADGTTWVQAHSSSGTTAGAPCFFYAPATNSAHTYLRITLTTTSNPAEVRLSGMQFLGSRWGDQGGGVEKTFPYQWDSSKRIGIGGAPSTLAKLKVYGYLSFEGGTVYGLPTPVSADEAANKGYVDTGLATKPATSRLISAGTGLTGGGDLSADRTLSVSYGSSSGTSVEGNDSRVTADQASGTASIRTLGTGAQQAAAGDHAHDSRYYTESEVDTALSGKSDVGHTHSGLIIPNPASGQYAYTCSYANSASTQLANNDLRLHPWLVYQSLTIDRIGAEVVTAAQSGGKFRLGIYEDNGNCYPGDLLLDAGQLSADATGTAQLTVSQVLSPGLYWVGGVPQSSATTAPFMRCASGEWNVPVNIPLGTSMPVSAVKGFRQTGVSGALPSTFSSTIDLISSVPRVFVRAS